MFDDRLLELGIELNGKLQVYSGADIRVKITKTADGKQNSCEVSISDLLISTSDYIVTESSPWNPSAKPKLLVINAGRASTGAATIYTGDITSAVPSMPPDRVLTMQAKTQDGNKYVWVSRKSPKTVQLRTLCQLVAEDYGLSLKFEATDKTVANYLFNGPLAKQILKLEQVGDINAYIDDNFLIVKDYGKALAGRALLVSANTNMVGVPVLDDKGVKVRVFFDPNIKLGQMIEIQSQLNPATNGQYTVYAMTISLASRAQDWYIDLSCNNDNIKSIAAKRAAETKNNAKPK